MRRYLVWAMVLLLAQCAQADLLQQVTTFSVDDTVDIEMHVRNLNSTEFALPLYPGAEDIRVIVDGRAQNVSMADGALLFGNATDVIVTYRSKELLDASSFVASMIIPVQTKEVVARLVLAEGMMLREPLDKGGSIYPKPDSSETDGRHMVFEWAWLDVEAGREIPLYARFKKRDSLLPLGIGIAIIGIVAAVVLRKRPAQHLHLKEEEEQIVNVLKQRERKSCEQGTLRVITGMSKAALSRLLAELEERNVIYKERRGRKNIVFLK